MSCCCHWLRQRRWTGQVSLQRHPLDEQVPVWWCCVHWGQRQSESPDESEGRTSVDWIGLTKVRKSAAKSESNCSHVYLKNVTILEPQVGKRKVNLVPHLQQIPKKWPGCGTRRRQVFFLVCMRVMVRSLPSPESHQDERQEAQSNCDTSHRCTGLFLECWSPKSRSHLGRRTWIFGDRMKDELKKGYHRVPLC